MKTSTTTSFMSVLMLFSIALAPALFTACSDDDDGSSSSNNQQTADEGSHDVSISGDTSASLSGGFTIFDHVDENHEDYEEDAWISVTFADMAGNYTVGINILEENKGFVEAGTYDVRNYMEPDTTAGLTTGAYVGLIFHESGTQYASISGSGSVTLETVNDERVVGTLNDVVLKEFIMDGEPAGEVIISGSFHAVSY